MAGIHRRGKRELAGGLFDHWLSNRHTDAPPESPPSMPVADAHTGESSTHAAPSPPGPSTNVDFTPRTKARRAVGVALLLAIAGVAIAGYAVYRDRNTLTVGLTVTLGVLVLLIWAVRAGSSAPRLSVRAGQLEVIQGGGRFVFDLTGGYTPIEVVGRPGDRDWKVLFLRRNLDPFVIDSSMVDPREFMDVLRRYRPE